jgi:hypothetical protein
MHTHSHKTRRGLGMFVAVIYVMCGMAYGDLCTANCTVTNNTHAVCKSNNATEFNLDACCAASVTHLKLNMPNITSMFFNNVITDLDLGDMIKLESLLIGAGGSGGSGGSNITNLTFGKMPMLDNFIIMDASITNIPVLPPSIREFIIMDTNVTTLALTNLTLLQTISIGMNSRLKSITMSNLSVVNVTISGNYELYNVTMSNMPLLKSCDLYYNTSNTNPSLTVLSLSGMPSLTSLNLNGTAITAVARGMLPAFKNLTTLTLPERMNSCSNEFKESILNRTYCTYTPTPLEEAGGCEEGCTAGIVISSILLFVLVYITISACTLAKLSNIQSVQSQQQQIAAV